MAKITDKLDNINTTLEKMLKVMDKPVHPIMKLLAIVGMIVSIMAIITYVDTVLKWF